MAKHIKVLWDCCQSFMVQICCFGLNFYYNFHYGKNLDYRKIGVPLIAHAQLTAVNMNVSRFILCAINLHCLFLREAGIE